MICTASQHLHHSFKFQLEKNGGETGYGEVRLHRQHVYLLVVLLLQGTHHLHLFCRKRGEELPLYTFLPSLADLCIGSPPHSVNKVLRRGYQCRSVVAYKIVAPLAVFVAHPSRKSEDIAVVVARQTGGD